MHAAGADYFQPFDLDRDPKCNILDDSAFTILMRLAWSGLVGAIWSAPPRKEYSRLKLRPGGQVLQAALSAAAQGGLEQPPSSMAWLEPENIQLLREWAAMDFYKSWALCATFPGIATLGGICSHPPGSHRIIAGVKNNGQYLSASAAQYPASLAQTSCQSLPCTAGPQFVMGGLNSAADHSNLKGEALPGVTDRILSYIRAHNLDNSILCHIAQSLPDHPSAAHHQHELVHIVHSFLHPECCNPSCAAITEGQPFRLELIGALAAALKDPDAALRSILKAGVPTGIFSPIQPSMQWPRKQDDLPCDAAETGQKRIIRKSWPS